jgi:hypothetical protein
MELPVEIQQRLNVLARTYASQFQASVNRELDKIRATGQLQNSVEVVVILATANTAPEIKIEYAEHGEFIGKRKLLFTKLVPPDQLMEWMEAENFVPSRIPGYKNGSAPNLTTEQKRKRFAFATAMDKKQNDTWKPKRWKRLALRDVLKMMNQDIIRAYTQEVEKILAREISNVT